MYAAVRRGAVGVQVVRQVGGIQAELLEGRRGDQNGEETRSRSGGPNCPLCSRPHVCRCVLQLEQEQEEEEDEFPFNMSDFVTVDEVGDVTDLPSPHAPSVPMETTEGEEDAPMCVEQDAPQVHPKSKPLNLTTRVANFLDFPSPIVEHLNNR